MQAFKKQIDEAIEKAEGVSSMWIEPNALRKHWRFGRCASVASCRALT